MSRRRCLLAVVVSLLAAVAVAKDRPLRSGARYQTELKEPFSANWRSVELRDVLTQLSLDHQIAILLDRRIDPNAAPPVEFAQESLRDGLTKLARQCAAGVSCPDNVVYLGPDSAARKLRTLIALRTAELSSPDTNIPQDRRQLWLKPRTVAWDDLDTPREILERLQTDVRFQISNGELIEHDLWAAAALPEVNGIAALSLILIQFDLTFAWREAGAAVELVPIPESVRIERSHKVPGKSLDKALADWQAAWPEAEFRQADREIVVLATVEVHEELDAGPAGRTKPVVKPAVVPLDKRQFTLQIKDVPALDLMAELEKSGIAFEFDAEALKAAGVDLNRFVQLDVRNLSAKEFFRAIFDPLGVKATFRGAIVKLTPK